MVSVLSRPQGIKISSGQSATIEEDYTADATVVKTNHSLPNNSWVYIKSRVENYNGFWQILVMNANRFQLQNGHGDLVPYVVDADITYYAQVGTSFYDWSAVHNPIVYRLKNDRWPVPASSVYTLRNIISFSNVNGYTQITASGVIHFALAAGFYLEIATANTASVNGVYRVVSTPSTSVAVLDLVYSSSYDFGNGTIRVSNHNYNIHVQIYAGIESGHIWEPLKPMELAATLKFIPDQNNEVQFSIHEVLKAYINQRNGLLLASLPNNIDAWTNFYIAYAESFDGLDFAFTTDSFVGIAVNAKMPFKNRYGGLMVDYLDTFLTLFETPMIFGGCSDADACYFDVSFITEELSANNTLKKEWYSNGVLSQTTLQNIAQVGEGLYRVQIEDILCDNDRVDISLIGAPIMEIDALSQWVNENTGGAAWVTGSTPSLTITGSAQTSDELTDSVTATASGTYRFDYNIDVTNGVGAPTIDLWVKGYRAGIAVGSSNVGLSLGSNISDIAVSFTEVPDKIAVWIVQDTSVGGDTEVTLHSFSQEPPVTIIPAKTFNVDCGCSDKEIRLTWLNNLGGFEYWNFKGNKDKILSIGETGETSVNLMPNWPNSYSEFADTEKRKQTFRETTTQLLVRSQNLTRSQVDAIAYIKSSVLVQIINSVYDKRTVIVDRDSFTLYNENDKLYSVSFTITYTDDIPAQTA
jgi:hypothetical protein